MASLGGGRGALISGMLSILYIYCHFYKKRMPIKNLFVFLLLVIVASIGLDFSREGKKFSNISVGKLLINFFYEQGNTVAVPFVIIEANGELEYRNYPFIFTPVFISISRILYPTPNEQTQLYLEKYNSMGSIVINKLNSGAYRYGAGLGGSFIAEMYDCGGFLGVIFWSIMLALLIVMVEKKIMISNYNIPIYWYIIGSIIILPRGNFFGFLNSILYVIFFRLFISSINFIFFPGRINIESYRYPLSIPK
jgi:oligosaccharide repeat unit polymerase